MCYIGSELWEIKFNGFLALVKVYRDVGNMKTLII